jgi:hypothetical protein
MLPGTIVTAWSDRRATGLNHFVSISDLKMVCSRHELITSFVAKAGSEDNLGAAGMSDSFGAWLVRLHKFMRDEAHRMGWEKVAGHIDPQFIKSMEQAVRGWMEKHPPTGLQYARRTWTRRPPTPGNVNPNMPAHLKGAAVIDEERRLAKIKTLGSATEAASGMRRWQSARHGVRGAANLVGMMIGMGTVGVGFLASKAGLAFMAKFAARWYIEDRIIDWGASKLVPMMAAIDEACCPATVAEAEMQYAAYLAGRHVTRINPKTGEYVELHDPKPAMSREEWLASAYGVRWDVLRRK